MQPRLEVEVEAPKDRTLTCFFESVAFKFAPRVASQIRSATIVDPHRRHRAGNRIRNHVQPASVGPEGIYMYATLPRTDRYRRCALRSAGLDNWVNDFGEIKSAESKAQINDISAVTFFHRRHDSNQGRMCGQRMGRRATYSFVNEHESNHNAIHRNEDSGPEKARLHLSGWQRHTNSLS